MDKSSAEDDVVSMTKFGVVTPELTPDYIPIVPDDADNDKNDITKIASVVFERRKAKNQSKRRNV